MNLSLSKLERQESTLSMNTNNMLAAPNNSQQTCATSRSSRPLAYESLFNRQKERSMTPNERLATQRAFLKNSKMKNTCSCQVT